MATKVIVRYKPNSPLHGGREISPKDLESIGIFTQKTRLVWLRENGFWLDAAAAGVSKETLEWLRLNTAEFTVETQEVDSDDPQALAYGEAYKRSLADSIDPDAPVEGEVVEGQSKSESTGTPRSGGTTTQSTAS